MSKKFEAEVETMFNAIEEATGAKKEDQEKEITGLDRFVLEIRGRRGQKKTGISLKLDDDIAEYSNIMSRMRGYSRTEYIGALIMQDLEEHRELYLKVLELKSKI